MTNQQTEQPQAAPTPATDGTGSLAAPAADMHGPVVLTAEESGTYLPDGQYRGLITGIKLRESVSTQTGEKYVYVDFTITEKATSGEIKVGFPARLTPRSDLGALFVAFGMNVPDPKTQTNLHEIFLSREVAFMVRNETNNEGTFSRVVKGSIRPTA